MLDKREGGHTETRCSVPGALQGDTSLSTLQFSLFSLKGVLSMVGVEGGSWGCTDWVVGVVDKVHLNVSDRRCVFNVVLL